jgi:hypothetical protein
MTRDGCRWRDRKGTMTSGEIPTISVNPLGYNLLYETAAGAVSWLGKPIQTANK